MFKTIYDQGLSPGKSEALISILILLPVKIIGSSCQELYINNLGL